MIKILFVCHGNICRSPLAEYLFKEMVEDSGLKEEFLISSAGTSYEELGNPVYPPVRRLLEARGINCNKKRAIRVSRADYDTYDYLICMDSRNLRGLEDIIDFDTLGKVHLLMEYAGKQRDVVDPYYSGDFESCYQDIMEGCQGLLEELMTFRTGRGSCGR